MSTLAEIYDFETPIEAAFKTLLTDAGLTSKTSADEFDFQKTRPRVDIQFTINGANDSRRFTCPDGKFRHDLYSGTLTLAVVTNPRTVNGIVVTTHTAYLTAVRVAMSEAESASLTDLEIRYVVPQSTTPRVTPEDGMEVSNLIYDVRFGIKPGSWPAV